MLVINVLFHLTFQKKKKKKKKDFLFLSILN